MITTSHFRTIAVDGLDIFYREAGSPSAPALLLLHGFPTSSNMFRNLIPRLASKFHVIAPDYPGFGQSSMPNREHFAYTFENLSGIIEKFTLALGLERFSIYVMDYGAPIGYRLAIRRPHAIQAMFVQNGNAYEEGLREFWDTLKKFWQDPSPETRKALHFLVEPDATRWQYQNGVADISLLDPTTWLVDQIGLDRPGNDELQLDLFYDYRTNLPLYPDFQKFFREYRPPTLITWGKNDVIFAAEGATPYQRDLPAAEVHLLDTGHFALETHGEEIAGLMLDFAARNHITQ